MNNAANQEIISDIWFETDVPLTGIAMALDFERSCYEEENVWAWIEGCFGNDIFNISRRHDQDAGATDTRIHLGGTPGMSQALVEGVARRLRSGGIQDVLRGQSMLGGLGDGAAWVERDEDVRDIRFDTERSLRAVGELLALHVTEEDVIAVSSNEEGWSWVGGVFETGDILRVSRLTPASEDEHYTWVHKTGKQHFSQDHIAHVVERLCRTGGILAPGAEIKLGRWEYDERDEFRKRALHSVACQFV